jgi:hypothetical protein
MNEDASRLCYEAATRTSAAIPHLASAMRVDRSVTWAISDLKLARDKLSEASSLVSDAIGRLGESL